MAQIIDSYSETNADTWNAGAYLNQSEAQSFSCDITGFVLSSAKFYLKKYGSPTGNATANIYAHSGTYGTSSVPTGSALATSGNFDVSTLSTTDPQLVEFTFTGANKINLAIGTKYVLVLTYAGGDINNYVLIGTDNSSPSHGGNRAYQNPTPTWAAVDTTDDCFYVYGVSSAGFFALL